MRVGFGGTVFRMMHVVTIDDNGCYHVQNVVSGLNGQHHVHTEEGFKKWVGGVKIEDVVLKRTAQPCGCGLKPGDIREHDGTVWHNDKFD